MTLTDERRLWLASYMRAWERHNIHFGLRSRKSDAWSSTGALEDYARVFHTVCLDLDAGCLAPPSALRQLPAMPFAELKNHLPPELSVAVAVTGGALTCRFPYAHRDAKLRGEINGDFLNPAVLRDCVLPVVGLLAPRVQTVLLCLAPVYATEEISSRAFIGKLDHFLDGLPPVYRYAVGMRNPGFLLPDYIACLRSHGAAHLFDETAMPPLLDQLMVPGVLTAGHAVCRNTPGPWTGPRSDNLWQPGVVETVRRCLAEKTSCYLYLDENTAPSSLEMLMTTLNADLAKRSPIRKRAA